MAVARNRTETRMQRKLLREFLDAEPSSISLIRPTLEKTAAGGLKKTTPQVLAPQLFRLIPFKKRLVGMTRDTPDGNIVNLPYVLLGAHDADVQPGDYFEYENALYDVLSIEPNRAYRTAANVTFRGNDGSHPQSA